ncbi:helix-turn-helix domain-containing protein [Bacillus sp. UMB0728]|uniref:helix-turn-helix domain-containing protein n=1 Tax=Bacillus sp. UMB0728 TaxID=2066052 RepID=UPI000C779825|nr:helix-turn-helix transcriptional regulator [Bacillus sp. UMB0728]PLR72248.1 hypothetical protein CYJ37_11880 [Bacillus sp. UMB0728]
MDVLAERLKWLRETKRLGQKEVAADLGITLSGFQKLQYGESKPKIETLARIAVYFNERSDFLLGLTDQTKQMENIKNKIEFTLMLLNEAKMDFANNAFNDKTSQSEKDRLFSKVNRLMDEVQSLSGEYVDRYVRVPMTNWIMDDIVSNKAPFTYYVRENPIMQNWELVINDSSDARLFDYKFKTLDELNKSVDEILESYSTVGIRPFEERLK